MHYQSIPYKYWISINVLLLFLFRLDGTTESRQHTQFQNRVNRYVQEHKNIEGVTLQHDPPPPHTHTE